MVTLDDLLEELHADIQRGIDAIDRRVETTEGSERTMRVAEIELDLPVGASKGTPKTTPKKDPDQGDRFQLHPGAGSGRFTVRFVPDRPHRESDKVDRDGLGFLRPTEPIGVEPPHDIDPPHPTLPPESDPDEPMAAPEHLKAVVGIGDRYEELLQAGGVSDIQTLARTKMKRVSSLLGVGPQRAERFVKMAKLIDLGTDPWTARLLLDSGLDAVRLAEKSASQIRQRVRQAAAYADLPDGYTPDIEQILEVRQRTIEGDSHSPSNGG